MGKDTEEMYHGKFITFEGTEGVGKTTQIELAKKYLQSRNIESLITREPGGTKIGERISCLLYTSPSPRDATLSRMPSSA